jgi:hypothetical protein
MPDIYYEFLVGDRKFVYKCGRYTKRRYFLTYSAIVVMPVFLQNEQIDRIMYLILTSSFSVQYVHRTTYKIQNSTVVIEKSIL